MADTALVFNILARGGRRTASEFERVARGADRVANKTAALGKIAAKVGKVTLIKTAQIGALAALAGGAASAAGSIVQLGAALAPAAGLLAALPGAALLAGAGILTLKVALSGLGGAFSAALSGDQEKFDKALDKMGPAARRVALEFKALVPALHGIRDAVQSAFFGPLHGQLTATASVLAGPLKSSMAGVAAEFGKGARAILEWVREARTVASIQQIFGSLRQTVAAVVPSLKPLLRGFLDLAVVGAKFIASLGPGFASLLKRFGEWMTKMATSGKAMEWMKTGLIVVKQLGTVLANVGGIIKSVFGAASASGGNLLGTFGQLTGELNKFLKTPAGQKALTQLFQGLAGIGRALAPVLTSLVKGIGSVAPAVGRIAEAVGPVLVTAIDALAPALKALEPGITALINGMGGAFKALAPALVPLAMAISAIAVALSPLLPAMGQLIAMLVRGLARHIMAMVASGALDKLVGAIIALGMALGQSLLDAITAISPYMPDLVFAITDLLIAITPLIPQILQLVIALIPAIPIIIDMITLFTEMANATMPLLIKGLTFLGLVISGLVGIMRWAWGYIAGYIRDRINNIGDSIDFLGKLPGKIIGVFSHAGDWLRDAGKNIVTGLINGIKGAVGKLWDTMGGIAGKVRDFWPFSPAKTGPLRTHPLDRAGRNIATMLASGMASGEALVARAAGGLAGAAVPAMAMAGGPTAVTPVGMGRAGPGSSRPDIDYDRMAAAIAREFRRLKVQMDEKTVGEIVSHFEGRKANQRRRTG